MSLRPRLPGAPSSPAAPERGPRGLARPLPSRVSRCRAGHPPPRGVRIPPSPLSFSLSASSGCWFNCLRLGVTVLGAASRAGDRRLCSETQGTDASTACLWPGLPLPSSRFCLPPGPVQPGWELARGATFSPPPPPWPPLGTLVVEVLGCGAGGQTVARRCSACRVRPLRIFALPAVEFAYRCLFLGCPGISFWLPAPPLQNACTSPAVAEKQ